MKLFDSKLVKVFNIAYCIAMVLLCSISSILLILGAFKNISIYSKISAWGFSLICIITDIYQIIESKKNRVINRKRRIVNVLLALVAIALLIVSFYF